MPSKKSFQEYYQLFKNEVISRQESLTDWTEGSINDVIAGGACSAVEESQSINIDKFKKTFFDTADGPEFTGGADDLQTLAVDHFGDDFVRLGVQKAVGVVTFTRANTDEGDVPINVGVVVKTAPDANGEAQRFEVIASVTMTGLEISAQVRALTGGLNGNVEAGEVTIIESSLLDSSIEVENEEAFSGGAAAQNDAVYRDYIQNLIAQLRGATIEAIEARAKTVPGIVQATGKEFVTTVIEWDPAEEETVGGAFKIVRAKLYVADANGTANDALVGLVETAISGVRATGVKVEVIGAEAVTINYSASISLNPSGPNYSTLVSDPSMIEDAMEAYIQNLAIGADFSRILARQHILNSWGPAGSNDLTDFVISTPAGDVVLAENQKAIPGTIGVA